MEPREIAWTRAQARLFLAGLLAGVLFVGCNRNKPKSENTKPVDPPAEEVAQKAETPAPITIDARYRQSFADATRAEPPPDCRPSDATSTGKSTGKLYTEVKRLWDTISLVGDDGKPLAFRAVLETKMGNIEIDLKPEIAPNHVRNFIALSRAGYYDGLLFEGVVHQASPDKPEIKTDLVVAGNP